MMAPEMISTDLYRPIQDAFGSRVQANIPLARYCVARVGGPADCLLEIEALDDLVRAVGLLWQQAIPFVILGGGSNVLVSDAGFRGCVLINHARQVRFGVDHLGQPVNGSPAPGDSVLVWAESGVNFGGLARQCAQRGLSGLEWAAGIPGTVGGAIAGNAGAHGADMRSSLISAAVISRETGVPVTWTREQLELGYRTSRIKQSRLATGSAVSQPQAVILSSILQLVKGSPEVAQARIDEFVAYRKRTQPPGASMGSMFKNPAGDYAGRLIEAAGMKGLRSGDAEISSLHANFFINRGNATAAQLSSLITHARQAVADQFGINLELEIELLGEWDIENKG
jgi:UDP-N-acetylmuramate dehydrogenase